jgi:hypothetical protein
LRNFSNTKAWFQLTLIALWSYLISAWNTTNYRVLPAIPYSLEIREHRNSRFRPLVITYFKAVYVPFRNFFPSNCDKTTWPGGHFLPSGYSASDTQNSQVLFFLDWGLLLLSLTEWTSFSLIDVNFMLTKIVGILLHINIRAFCAFWVFYLFIAHFCQFLEP